MIHLRAVKRSWISNRERQTFPFNVPVIAQWQEPLTFTREVTFLAGENGSGKSTFLEGLACLTGLPTAGHAESARDRTLDQVRPLSRRTQAVWSHRTHEGFFLRAEDFFGFVQRTQTTAAELKQELARVETDYAERSETAQQQARMPFARELSALTTRYGDNMDAQSHGEGFLAFFQSRFVPRGLYLLDEPETPLSPLRQLGLLALLKEMVEERDAQFIIATHSPILMAYPDATILNFDQAPFVPIAYDDLEHVRFTRAFLNHPASYLRHL